MNGGRFSTIGKTILITSNLSTTKLFFLQKRIIMTHKYYDFYMRFPSFEDAEKAQKFYNETHKPRIGGKFVTNYIYRTPIIKNGTQKSLFYYFKSKINIITNLS